MGKVFYSACSHAIAPEPEFITPSSPEEQERREATRREEGRPLLYVACFAVFLLFRVVGSDRPSDWAAWPVGVLVGAALAHGAFRYLGLGRTAAKSIWAASAVGFVVVIVGTPLLLSLPLFPPPLPPDIPMPVNVVHGAVEGFLLGVLVIAVERYRRFSAEDRRI